MTHSTHLTSIKNTIACMTEIFDSVDKFKKEHDQKVQEAEAFAHQATALINKTYLESRVFKIADHTVAKKRKI